MAAEVQYLLESSHFEGELNAGAVSSSLGFYKYSGRTDNGIQSDNWCLS